MAWWACARSCTSDDQIALSSACHLRAHLALSRYKSVLPGGGTPPSAHYAPGACGIPAVRMLFSAHLGSCSLQLRAHAHGQRLPDLHMSNSGTANMAARLYRSAYLQQRTIALHKSYESICIACPTWRRICVTKPTIRHINAFPTCPACPAVV